MRKFNNEFLQRVKDSTNLIDVIRAYGIDVKKKGSRYWACCPFHHEKTPSFSISPEDGFYYCFGCHESGDSIKFIEKMDQITFPDAVERLAEMGHVELPPDEISEEDKREAALVHKLYEVTELAGNYFHNCLLRTNIGKDGLAYFKKRHLDDKTIETFKLGFAPPEWERLYCDFTKKKNISPDILLQAGLVGHKNGKYYDTFRNRCMFPIMDLKGRIVAFGGRIMHSEESAAKYLNSPETVIFNKRRLLFPIYQALPEIRRKRQAIMVEGYMDAISLHAHGIKNVVASLGTAFTVEQARLLKKYADEVIFSYDMDAAGQNATRRALEIAGSVGLKLRVALLGEGKDPDEFVNLHGGDEYLEVIDQAVPALDYLFQALRTQYDGATLEGQQKILNEMFAVLTVQDNTYQFNSFIRKMARTLHMDEGLIRSEAIRYTKKNNSHVYISPNVYGEERTGTVSSNDGRQRRLEQELLKYCLVSHILPEGFDSLEKYSFADEFIGRLYDVLKQAGKGNITVEYAEARLERSDLEQLAQLMMTDYHGVAEPYEEYIRPMRKIYLQNEYKFHTQRAAELMESDPQKAKEEQLTCIRLSEEIRLIGG